MHRKLVHISKSIKQHGTTVKHSKKNSSNKKWWGKDGCQDRKEHVIQYNWITVCLSISYQSKHSKKGGGKLTAEKESTGLVFTPTT